MSDHEDALLPEWDSNDPGGRAAMDARLQDLALQAIENDPRWPRTLMALSEDLVNLDQVPEMLSSVCTFVVNMAIWVHCGRDEAIERFKSDLVQLRRIATKAGE
jgi:hypothetical protein